MWQPNAAPDGARCAVHVDRKGALVCARCGAFMCEECSLGGASPQCPACREKTGGRGFPFTRDDFDFNRLWDYALAHFKRDWLMLSLALLIFMAALMVAGTVVNLVDQALLRVLGLARDPHQPTSIIKEVVASLALSQTVGTVLNVIVQGAATMGLMRVVVDSLTDRPVDLARLASQLGRLPQYVLANLLLFLVGSGPVLLLLGAYGAWLVMGVGLSFDDFDADTVGRLLTPATVGVGLMLMLAVSVYAFALLPLTLWTPVEMVVGQAGPMEALRRVWTLTSGARLAVVGYSLIGGLCALVGTLACCVGALPGLALSYLLTTSLYLALRNTPEVPPLEG